jgi:hypothetical protein
MGLLPYGKAWREQRKLAHQYMKPEHISRYESTVVKRALELVENLSETPDDFLHHVRTLVFRLLLGGNIDKMYSASTGIIMSILYDYEIARREDPYVDLAKGALLDLWDATEYSGSSVINKISVLPYLPSWLHFQRRLTKTRETGYALRSIPFENARKLSVRNSFFLQTGIKYIIYLPG